MVFVASGAGKMNHHEKKVVIVQATARHYRAKFFSALHGRLAQDHIDLRVIYSNPNAEDAKRCDCVELDASVGLKVRANWLFSNRLVYQHARQHLSDAHLVIVEHASRYLLNYALFANRVVSQRKIALWGHGFNRTGTSLGRFLRRLVLRLPDWWFAYSGVTLRYLLANGIPSEVTTNVQNAIDTEGLRRAAASISSEQAQALRRALRIGPEARVGLYCGSLYPHKRLPMLIAACRRVQAFAPNFHLIIMGDGPDRNIVEDAVSRHSWIHYVGAKFGEDRASYFRIADLLLNPGLVGLGILDAFAVGLPVLTTDIPIHGPEIEYLDAGNNAIVTPHDILAYADAVVGVLGNHELLGWLREGASRSGHKYTLENMVKNFTSGVEACLEYEGRLPQKWGSYLRSRAPNS
jgi:glycosyltransferase involved in cell wall biosynthesis